VAEQLTADPRAQAEPVEEDEREPVPERAWLGLRSFGRGRREVT
jgi:hypothetical protein